MLPLEILSQFLRNLADQIEQKTATEGDLQLATEHYLAHHFALSKPLTEEEATKYMALGWYIYSSQNTEQDN